MYHINHILRSCLARNANLVQDGKIKLAAWKDATNKWLYRRCQFMSYIQSVSTLNIQHMRGRITL